MDSPPAEDHKLFSYQKEGERWLRAKRYALLADEMGLGKSAQAIAASEDLTPILVLSPAVARLNWKYEFQKFSTRTLRFCAVLTAADASGIPSSDVTFCSYDLALATPVSAALRSRRWALLVLDEVHFMKEATAARTRNVFGSGGLVHNSDRVWCLSGTP